MRKSLLKNAQVPGTWTDTALTPKELKSIMASWPFMQWGPNLINPFSTTKGGAKFVIVAVDYFTKWVEAEPLASITS